MGGAAAALGFSEVFELGKQRQYWDKITEYPSDSE
jgi:hypothetical protein